MTDHPNAPAPDGLSVERLEAFRLDCDEIRRKGATHEIVAALCTEALSIVNSIYALRQRCEEAERERDELLAAKECQENAVLRCEDANDRLRDGEMTALSLYAEAKATIDTLRAERDLLVRARAWIKSACIPLYPGKFRADGLALAKQISAESAEERCDPKASGEQKEGG